MGSRLQIRKITSYLRFPSLFSRLVCIYISILVLIIGLGAGYYFKNQHDERVYTDNLYRTATGSKYHVRDCMYIKDKTDVQRLTREEFDSGEYEPCNACKPD